MELVVFWVLVFYRPFGLLLVEVAVAIMIYYRYEDTPPRVPNATKF